MKHLDDKYTIYILLFLLKVSLYDPNIISKYLVLHTIRLVISIF